METLIAEDLLLLLLDDRKGTIAGTSSPETALGGSLLVELALEGAVEVAEKTSVWRTAKVRAVPTATPTDPLLRGAYDVVAEKPRSAQDLVSRLGKRLRPKLGERLVARGILERRDAVVLGLFTRTKWPAVDIGHELVLRGQITAALLQGVEPDDRTRALIALLSALGIPHKVVDRTPVSKGAVRKRAKQLAEGDWAAKAVRDAIQASTAAVMAGVTAASSAAATSGS